MGHFCDQLCELGKFYLEFYSECVFWLLEQNNTECTSYLTAFQDVQEVGVWDLIDIISSRCAVGLDLKGLFQPL